MIAGNRKQIPLYMCIILLISSCHNGAIQESDELYQDRSVQIQFSLPEAEDGEASTYEAVCYNIRDSRAAPLTFPVQAGENSIPLSTADNYMVGIIQKEQSSSTEMMGSRSISSAISKIGTIKIAAQDLQTLPMNEGSAGIDFGSLAREGDDFTSQISSSASAQALNRDENFLEEYGNSDSLLIKYLNPDIDRNGEYDHQQENPITWDFHTQMYFAVSYGNQDFDNNNIPFTPEDLVPTAKKYAFQAYTGFPALQELPLDEIRLYLPESANLWYRSDSASVPYLLYSLDTPIPEGIPQITFADDWAFRADYEGRDYIEGDMLAEGDYRLMLGEGNLYYIDNVDFYKPSENFERFIFPLFKLVLDGDVPMQLLWRWYHQKDGTFIPARDDLVEMMVTSFEFGYGSGSIWSFADLTEQKLSTDGFSFTEAFLADAGELADAFLGVSFRDIANNHYHWIQSNGGPGMDRNIEAFDLEVRP